MKIEEKLALWTKITGVNPQEDRKSWTISLSGSLSDWDIKKMNDKLMEVVKHDISGVFTNIFLKNYFDDYLKGKSASFFELVSNEFQYLNFISDCKLLRDAIYEDVETEKTILDETRRFSEYYGIKENNLSVFDIVYLRISAEENINRLNTVQFRKGSRIQSKPKYMRDVYMMDNLDKLIKAAETEVFDGISVNYIVDQESPESSYFAFLIKNGQNVFLLCDKPTYMHPNQKFMSRCPGRQMADRIDKTYFPYSLTNIKIHDRYSVTDGDSKTLKSSESDIIKIGTISDMDAAEALWIINMFSLIEKKFFEESFECEQISYVGGMINHPMLSTSDNSLVVYNSYDKIELPFIEHPEDIKITYKYESANIFQDTIDRLKDKVDMNVVNSIGYSDKNLLEDKSVRDFHDSRRDMLALNQNDFGTKEELEYRQQWIARYNFAEQINRLAKEEYDTRKKEIEKWYTDRVMNNIDNVIDMVINNQLNGTTIISHQVECLRTEQVENIVKKLSYKEYRNSGYSWGGYTIGQNKFNEELCIFTRKSPNVAILIFPNNVEDLMLLTRCKKEEIPDVLLNWSPYKKEHGGNSILSNIDPCDWVIRDYWYKFTAQIDILLSTTAYNDLYKKRGLKPDKFWLESKIGEK